MAITDKIRHQFDSARTLRLENGAKALPKTFDNPPKEPRPSKLPFPMFKPFAFKQKLRWSDGFDSHGIFEIYKVDDLYADRPTCTIRRIATARTDAGLGEDRILPASYLKDLAQRVNWDSFLPSDDGKI